MAANADAKYIVRSVLISWPLIGQYDHVTYLPVSDWSMERDVLNVILQPHSEHLPWHQCDAAVCSSGLYRAGDSE